MTTRRGFETINLKLVADNDLHFALLCDTPFLLGCATHPALRAPLSEKGWLRSPLLYRLLNFRDGLKNRHRAIPSRRGVPEGRGVSHHTDILYLLSI